MKQSISKIGLTPQGYLDFYPRIAPPLLERLGSPAAWVNLATNLVVPLIQSKAPQHWSTAELVHIKDRLRQQRNQEAPETLRQ